MSSNPGGPPPFPPIPSESAKAARRQARGELLEGPNRTGTSLQLNRTYFQCAIANGPLC